MRLEHLLSGALVIRVTFYILYYVVFVLKDIKENRRGLRSNRLGEVRLTVL